MRSYLEPGDVAYWPNLLTPSNRSMTVLDRNKIRRSWNPKDPRYHQIQYVQYLVDGLIDELVRDMHTNVSNDWDNIIVVTGAEGTGKSNLAYYLAKKFNPDFEIKDGYVYDFETMVTRLNSDKVIGSVLWLDEATALLGNRDWAREENKSIIKVLQMMRSYGLTIIMCIPDLNSLDVYVRDKRVRYILEAKIMAWEGRPEKTRGYFELKTPRPGQDPETRGYGLFPPMDPEVNEEYKATKLRSQKTALGELYKKINPDKGDKKREIRAVSKMAVILHDENGLTYDEIADIIGIPAGTIRRNIKQMRDDEGD